MDDPKTLNAVFQAVSDENRRKIIDLLREAGELKVGDIANTFEMSLNGVSKHLKVLESSGLIYRRIEGRTHYISLDNQGFDRGYRWFHFYTNFWNQRLNKLNEFLNKGRKND